MQDWNWLQWPAMAVSVLAAWLVGSRTPTRRKAGFWWFLFSNVLWVVWGWFSQAWALIVLQFALAVLNIRGAAKNRKAEAQGEGPNPEREGASSSRST